jgi:thioredoxin 1
MAPTEITSTQQLKSLIAARPKVVVDWTATWCGPCRLVKPVYHRLSDELASRLTFAVVDVDQCREAAAQFNIQSMPTFQVYVGGKLVDTLTGANAQRLEEMVRRHA